MMLTMAHLAIALMAGFAVAGMVWYTWGAVENLTHRLARTKPAEATGTPEAAKDEE